MSDYKLDKKQTARLANAAFDASGCKTHEEFCALFDNSIAVRTFRGWLGADNAINPVAAFALTQFIDHGWRPKVAA